ncbi:MAG TPA: tRNA uracil 4-sulfurtransferase ThiI [Eubacteriales bacterium]|nr:tRNA uracil 4-sulfurtransferase ThiI [Eubacteriales bacterium]
MRVIVLRYSEIHLKGANRSYFENMLFSNIKTALSGYEYTLEKSTTRYLIRAFNEDKTNELVDKLKNVFGLHSLSLANEVNSNIDEITQAALSYTKSDGSFKVVTNRADKTFPMRSMDVSAEIGGRILNACSYLTVDVKNPDWNINIDIRENGKTLIYRDVIKCVNGMPVGTGGKGILLLSGGIDSPVAGYMMAKRGMSIRALHFHSYPYTSQLAKDKVLQLAALLKKYSIHMTVDIVSVTKIQTEIHKKCPEEFMITILRRFMMRIAENIAKEKGIGAIITGESLGQVASQTLESIISTNSVVTLPMFRPLIGFDKDEIIEIAKRIGTFETSILPYEDCCTVFLPKNPVTRPKLKIVEKVESVLDVDELIAEALQSVETVEI